MPRLRYKFTNLKYFAPSKSDKHNTITPTDLLAEVVAEKLRDLGAGLTNEYTLYGAAADSGWNGSLSIVAERAAALRNDNPEATYRRITAILGEESEVTDFGIADAILLAAETNINRDTNLPILPTSVEAAEELVRCHFYSQPDRELTDEDKGLAHALYRFSHGFVNGPRIFADKKARERERRNRHILVQRRRRRINRQNDNPATSTELDPVAA